MNKKEKIDALLKGKQYLKCNYLYSRNYDEILRILEMKEWKEPKFRPLLTSSIWHSNYDEIFQILNMPEWDDPKFQPLLTSSIWCSNYKNIKSKLDLKYWSDPRYSKLLKPTIFAIKEQYIVGNIELFEEYGISKFIVTNSLKRNPDEQRFLLNYLLKNKIELIVDYKLNPIFNATKKVLKEKYNIDIKKLMNNAKKEKVLCKK